MGYNTDFLGELKFTTELTGKALAKVKSFLGENCRDHPEWNSNGSYIQLEFNDDFTGLKWDGNEKTYGMTESVNLIIRETKKEFPDFGLQGQFICQGEDIEDRWLLKIENGIAIEKKIEIKGEKIRCPHCEEEFLLETEE
ncbi:MAG TPA: hypothetical protein VF677_05810 [Flavobacterium sp.]|jgi:hypothetical protein